MMINKEFWKGKKVLVTGHTGFKGSWLSIWLIELGAEVIGYSLDPYTEKDNFVLAKLDSKLVDIRGDVRNLSQLESVFSQHKPDVVFHLAAQPLVRASYDHPIETYETNVLGTINVLECIRQTTKQIIGVMITTDKCYENKEQLDGYKETDPMGGYDPYSSSKGCAELVISSWIRSYFHPNDYSFHSKSIASVRAGNVIGGGDWSSDRIIPDCVRSIENSQPISIRNPKAIRPWQHVLEPLGGYLLLAEKMGAEPTRYCEGWNFGPNEDAVLSVWEVAEKVISVYGKGNVIDVSNADQPHEATLLMLNIDKAKKLLSWYPRLTIDEMLDFTIDWYKNYKKQDVYKLCVKQIERFMNVNKGDENGH